MIYYFMKVIRAKLVNNHSHIEVDVASLDVDYPLVFDIYIKKDDNYLIIIEAGVLLTDELYLKLTKQSAIYIVSKDKNNQNLSCDNLKRYLQYNINDTKRCLKFLYEINKKTFDDFYENENDNIDIKCIKSVVKSIIYLIENEKGFLVKSISQFLNRDEIAYHSLHVTIYALNIGHSLKLRKTKLIELGIAAILHDIGHKKIDSSIFNKENILNDEEKKEIKRHTKYSAEIVKRNHIHEPYIIDAITHHHEYQDGSGYPDKLRDNEIEEFASIICICDIFDALTNNRAYREKFSTFEALKMMMKDEKMSQQLDLSYVKLFLKSLT